MTHTLPIISIKALITILSMEFIEASMGSNVYIIMELVLELIGGKAQIVITYMILCHAVQIVLLYFLRIIITT